MSICPVVNMIEAIRAGGYFEDDQEATAARVVRLGGMDQEYVLDDARFHLNLRLMEFARHELSRPDLATAKRKFGAMFDAYLRGDIYSQYMERSEALRLLHRQFVGLCDLIARMEEWILMMVHTAARRGRCIDISLPDLTLPGNIDIKVLYSPDQLRAATNAIIGHVRRININSLLDEPLVVDIEPLPEFGAKSPDFSQKVPRPYAQTSADYLDTARRILDIEAEIVDYIIKVEEYHCEVINRVNLIFIAIGKILRKASA